jgi:uncharacterized membrane protein YdjX (TVP38/TMEM64 family)
MKLGPKKILFLIVWVAIFVEVLFDHGSRDHLIAFLDRHPDLSPVLLVLAQVTFASLILPCSPFGIVAGVLWGYKLGIVYSLVATIASSLWTFVLARYLFKNRAQSLSQSQDWLRPVLRLLDRHKWKASTIAHANPLLPGSSLGYAFGVSNVTMPSFILGALVGTLPLQLIVVGIGHWLGRDISNLTTGTLVVVFGLVSLLVAYRLLVPRLLKKENHE